MKKFYRYSFFLVLMASFGYSNSAVTINMHNETAAIVKVDFEPATSSPAQAPLIPIAISPNGKQVPATEIPQYLGSAPDDSSYYSPTLSQTVSVEQSDGSFQKICEIHEPAIEDKTGLALGGSVETHVESTKYICGIQLAPDNSSLSLTICPSGTICL